MLSYTIAMPQFRNNQPQVWRFVMVMRHKRRTELRLCDVNLMHTTRHLSSTVWAPIVRVFIPRGLNMPGNESMNESI